MIEYKVKKILGKKVVIWDILKHRRHPTQKEIIETFQKEFPDTRIQDISLHEGAGHGFLYLHPR